MISTKKNSNLISKNKKKWEHKTVYSKTSDIQKNLDEYGENGWELISACAVISDDLYYYRLFFKRSL